MKKLILIVGILLSQISLAAPFGMYLAQPKTIRVDKHKKQLVLRIDLNCSEYYEEWHSHLVSGSDDSGDRAIAIGLLLSESNCESSKVKKEFTFRFDLKEVGVNANDNLDEIEFEPINIKE